MRSQSLLSHAEKCRIAMGGRQDEHRVHTMASKKNEVSPTQETMVKYPNDMEREWHQLCQRRGTPYYDQVMILLENRHG